MPKASGVSLTGTAVVGFGTGVSEGDKPTVAEMSRRDKPSLR